MFYPLFDFTFLVAFESYDLAIWHLGRLYLSFCHHWFTMAFDQVCVQQLVPGQLRHLQWGHSRRQVHKVNNNKYKLFDKLLKHEIYNRGGDPLTLVGMPMLVSGLFTLFSRKDQDSQNELEELEVKYHSNLLWPTDFKTSNSSGWRRHLE